MSTAALTTSLPAAPPTPVERALRRAGDGLHRWADRLQCWRAVRARTRALALLDELSPRCLDDLGAPEAWQVRARGHRAAELQRLQALRDGLGGGAPLWPRR